MKILLNQIGHKTRIVLEDGTDITEEMMVTHVGISAGAGDERTEVTLTLMIDSGSITMGEEKK